MRNGCHTEVCQPGQKSEFWAGRNFLVVDRMSEDDRPIRGAMGSPHELLTKKKGVRNGQFGPNWPPMEEKSKIVKNSNIIALFFPSCKVKEWNCPSKPVVGHSHPLRPQIRPNQARYWSYTGYHTINWKKKEKILQFGRFFCWLPSRHLDWAMPLHMRPIWWVLGV